MATARKAPADRKTRAVRPIVKAPVARSLVEIVSTPAGEEAEPIPVFSIDGVVYSMPATVPASLALEMLDRMRTENEAGVIAWMIEAVLGTEAYAALKGCESLTSEQLKGVIDHVNDHVNGTLGDVTGN